MPIATKAVSKTGSSLKDSTKRLMEVLAKIRANRKAEPLRKNRPFVQPHSYLGYGTRMAKRKSLAQSHRQVKAIGQGKGYREYLKRGM